MKNPLDNIGRLSALEFINQVRKATNPPGSTFISALDDHILDALPPPLTSEASTLNRGDVIEIQGGASSGKTQLLYFFSMTCVLPYDILVSAAHGDESTEHKVLLGGREKGVVVYDCDGRWSITRFSQLLTSYLEAKLNSAFADPNHQDTTTTFTPSLSTITEQCLSRMHIFRPTSSLSLAFTLRALPSYHLQKMRKQEICMVMIDSLSAFHHSDKWRIEDAALLDKDHPRPAADSLPRSDINPLRHVLSALQYLRSQYGIITFITNWALISQQDGKSLNTSRSTMLNVNEWFGQHLLSPYPRVNALGDNKSLFRLTHHISLPLEPLPPFPSGTTLSQALGDEERREMCREFQILGLVRTPVKRPGSDAITIKEGTFEISILEDSIRLK